MSKEVSIKKVIIRDAGWNYDRNELGVVTARYKGAYLIYSVGGKTMMKEMSFKQPATGGGAFGSWQYRGHLIGVGHGPPGPAYPNKVCHSTMLSQQNSASVCRTFRSRTYSSDC